MDLVSWAFGTCPGSYLIFRAIVIVWLVMWESCGGVEGVGRAVDLLVLI